MKTLTVFTPTYNRKHTLPRTYESLCRQTCKDFDWLVIDDGSSDGTREWIESLGPKTISSGQKFDWMGRIVEGKDENHFVIQAPNVRIEYVYKPNGGLYSGYNVAYQTIQTELCVCIDSDDYMPEDAVEKIVEKWNTLNEFDTRKYCGIVGLDFDVRTMEPIGGYFPEVLKEVFHIDLELKKLHSGDTKEVMRTELMKKEAPMIGFIGEKNFNPWYLFMTVCDEYPMLVINDNLCWVEYQIGLDSMSQGIWKQYVNSPKSYALYRLRAMSLTHNTWKNKVRLLVHYISSCILSKDKDWIKKSPYKLLTILLSPLGLLVYFAIRYKTRE